MNKKWHHRFLTLADHVSTWSKDPRTKVGAVIVNEHKQVIGLGYNGFPRGVFDTIQRYDDRSTKLLFVAHAEQNALDNSQGTVRGATLYSTLFPCFHCAKTIIQRGISHIVTRRPEEKYLLEPHHFQISLTMFEEAGIIITYIDDLHE